MLSIEINAGAIVYLLDKFLCLDGVRTDIAIVSSSGNDDSLECVDQGSLPKGLYIKLMVLDNNLALSLKVHFSQIDTTSAALTVSFHW